MKYVLPTISLTLFGQIFEFFLLIYLCGENENIDRYNSIKCPAKSFYYSLCVLCAFALLFLVIISYCSISMYYRPLFIKDKNRTNSLSKIDSFPNRVFFINKIIIIVLTCFDTKSQLYTWFILVVFFFSTFGNMISFTKYNNYENKILLEINKFFSVLLFNFITNLIIGKIFNAWGFNATLSLNLFGIIIAIISAFAYKSSLSSFSYVEFKELCSGCEQILYIRNFLDLVKTKHLCREKTLTFESLILIREENCIDKNCKLKKYLKTVEKGKPNDFILYQYCQSLYEIAIKKFPNDVILKINYIVFLITQMSKRKLAEKIFYTMKVKLFHFEGNFVIYCCKKFIETYSNSSENIFKEKNNNVMKRTEFEKLNQQFKEDLVQASSLYYEFWNILYKYHIQGIENFYKLNSIGKELTILINEIEEKFKVLHNVKGDDASLLYLYSGFIKYILGNKEKYENLKNILESISNVDKIKDFEVDYTNFDSKILDESDENKYLILSAEEENLGTIINASYSATKIFGYTKQELIGKKFSFLLPYISQKEFDNYLVKQTNHLKIRFYEALTNKKEYYPQIDELFVNAKDKSKYLVPVYIKSYFVQTEESNHAYIMILSYLDDINLNKFNDVFKLGSIFNPNKQKEEKLYKYCVVLTDMNFIIQTFTANCQEHLGLNTNSMSSNIDLTQFIYEFNNAVYKIILEKKKKLNEKFENNDVNLLSIEGTSRSERKSKVGLGKVDEDISPEKEIMYKRYIAEKNYSESKLITWKSEALENYLVVNKSGVEGTNINLKGSLNFDLISGNAENNNEKLFLLIILKAQFINNNQFGYLFIFRREQVNCIEKKENLIKSSINEINSVSPKNKNKNLLKPQKSTFSTFKSSDDLNSKNEKENEKNNENDKEEEIENEIKYSKSQKKIEKMPKSLEKDIVTKKKEENIVGLIESKIKNILKDDFGKNTPIKKCSFNQLSTNLSLIENKDKKNEELPEMVSGKRILESIFQSQNYTPKCNFNFSLDMNLMSFKPSYTLLKSKDFNDLLKTEAEKKINLGKNLNKQKENEKENNSSDYSSNEENESVENEEYSSSKTFTDSKKEIPKKIVEKKKKEENIKDDINKEYYRVSGLNKIKFMVFDFEQEMVIEKEGQKENKSEVENILLNYRLKLPTLMDKDGNDPSVKINKFLLKYSNKDLIKDKLIRMDSTSQIKNTQKVKKQKEICKKLETELNKKEKERSIVSFFILALILNIILLGMGAFSFYFTLFKLGVFKDHLSLIIYASLLRHYINLGIYHTRMYTLSKIDHPIYPYIYTNYEISQNRTKYIQDLYDKLQEDFSLGSSYLELMIAIDANLDKKNKDKLYTKSMSNVLFGNSLVRGVSSSYIVGITEIFSHFYYMVANIDNLEFNSTEVLNFMYNALNNGGIAFKEIINIYIDEIKHKKKTHTKLTYIIIVVYFVLLALMFAPIKINYRHILYKRDCYISTFYQINLNFIRTSILKCEKFLNQLNPNELIINKDEKKEAMDNTASVSNFEDNVLSNEQLKKNVESNLRKIRKGNVKSKGNKRLMIIFLLSLLAIFLYLFILLIEFNNYLSNFEIMALYMYHMLHYHNNVINIYNSFNEYLFYEDSMMYNTLALDFLEQTINETYDTIAEDLNYIGTYSRKIPGLYDVYSKVQKEQLCKEIVCENYIETVTSLGYYSFVAFFMTEIKVKINYVRILTQSRASIMWGDDTIRRALILYNNIHYDVDVMFNDVVLHYIKEEITLTALRIFENFNSRNNFYIAIYTVFFVLIIFLYIIYWAPYIIDTQDQIHKTKEALNIIPVEILESQTNIKSLLGISDLNE